VLLDRLFPNEAAAGVAVLNATYNTAMQIDQDTDRGKTAVGALRDLLLRLLNDLVFDRCDWREIRGRHSPLVTADNPIQVRAARARASGEVGRAARAARAGGRAPALEPESRRPDCRQ
jgi:hypothetical protein